MRHHKRQYFIPLDAVKSGDEDLGQGLGGANYQYEKSGWGEQRDATASLGFQRKLRNLREIYLEIQRELYY